MFNCKKTFLSIFRLAFLFSALLLSGCASFYVDGTTKEIDASQFKQPAELHPVQALFEFQTDGKRNERATNYLKNQVLGEIKSSGLFSDVSEEPVEGGALLSITLNNVPVTDDAFTKGFVTGLTFGIAGSEVTDGYICKVSYIDNNSTTAIEKRARHAIHTTVGNSSEPANAKKAKNMEEAVTTMTHQILSNVLNDLSHDPDFQ